MQDRWVLLFSASCMCVTDVPAPLQIGNSQVVLVDSTGLATAASDPRKDGAPAAVLGQAAEG